MPRTPLFLALLAASAATQAAQQPAAAPTTIHDIPRLADGIVIDGKLDDAAWATAAEYSMDIEISPGDNTPAEATTSARIGHTTDALYLSFRARDPDPKRIRAHLRDRDAAYRDDFIGIMLDTFDDQRRAYEFFVNPLGVQMDLINDQATHNEDDSWDGLWTSAGRITAEGYEVEMRIPFATLRFRDGEDAKRWALMLFRSYPRNVRHQFTNNPVSRDSNCLLCTFEKFEGMAGAQPGRNLEIVPSVTVARPETRDGVGGDWEHDGIEIEPGVDVSWAPSPNMTLNGTLNPDFSQVETDQAQVNLNDSFALFFPEKRPFFLEGADYFSTQFDVLYTRQVADPKWGLRVTGRNGDSAYGAFIAQDDTTVLLVPGVVSSGFTQLDQPADVAVGRYRYNLNADTTLGVIGTFRRGEDYANDVVGVDGRWQRGAHTLEAQLLHSQSEYPLDLDVDPDRADDDPLEYDDRSPSGDALRAYYGYSDRNWDFFTSHTEVDRGFRADLGFIGQVGYDKDLVGGSHSWYGEPGEKITKINLYTDFDITHRFDGQLLERELEASLNLQGPRQSNINVFALNRVRLWNGEMFDESNYGAGANAVFGGAYKIGANLNFGQRVDLRASRVGDYRQLNVWGQLDLGTGVEFTPDVTWSRLERDGGTAFSTMVLDARLSWQIDPRQRLRLTLQGSHIERDVALYSPYLDPDDVPGRGGRDWGGQILYSYKVNPRTAFYGGISYGIVSDEPNGDLYGNSRGVFLKYSYGWQPGG